MKRYSLRDLSSRQRLAGHVADGETAEVGQAGLGANAGELGVVDEDLVGAELVLPGFDGGELGVEAGLCVVVGVAGGFGGHKAILPGLARCQEEGDSFEQSPSLVSVIAAFLAVPSGGRRCRSARSGVGRSSAR